MTQTTNKTIDSTVLESTINQAWDNEVIPQLIEFIKIPNKSPMFDPDWEKHGHMETAITLISNWCQAQNIPGMTYKVVRLEGRTPLIFMEIPGQSDDTVLFYGHIDKQPEMTGWDDDLGPWKPVVKNEKLYGRGGADDGYSGFASITAIQALQQQNIPHARCVIILEACEESGSYDLPFYLDLLKNEIGEPSLVICLDSGAGNYEQLWITTSLRGLIGGRLKVETVSEGVHSGDATGIVASSFRIARDLLSRIEDPKTGKMRLSELDIDIPEQRRQQAKQCAAILGDDVYQGFPLHDGVQPVDENLTELVLNRTWRAALAITGASGIPDIADAGNVLRPETSLRLSVRIPPYCDPDKAQAQLQETLEKNPPYQAKVTFEPGEYAEGWNAPIEPEWLINAAESASQTYFSKSVVYMGEGGTIPLMGKLSEKFPKAQFLVTGVLGPHANAHGPNEFLHIEYGKKVTCCVAQVLAAHFNQE